LNTQRPKGILKNSYSHKSPILSPVTAEQNPTSPISPVGTPFDKDTVIENTLINAGRPEHATRALSTRRQSRGKDLPRRTDSDEEPASGQRRLQWDEAALYLTEQQKCSTMKIDEPKTPFASHYNPAEDEEELRRLEEEEARQTRDSRPTLGGGGLERTPSKSRVRYLTTKDEDIPDIELGEAELGPPVQKVQSPVVKVEPEYFTAEDAKKSEEDHVDGETEEEKHRRFMEMRKRHYEMREVKDLLAHPEEEVALEEEESEEEDGGKDVDGEGDSEMKDSDVPPVPNVPAGLK